MLDFNNAETADRRCKAKELTLQEEELASKLIKDRFVCIDQQEEDLLTRFFDYYNNLATYLAYTRGLWVTEFPERVSDPEKKLYHLGNEPNNYQKRQDLTILLEELDKTQDFQHEEHFLIHILNKMITLWPVKEPEEKLLQRYLDHFQNLEHYRAYTSGIMGTQGFWFTDEPDKIYDPEKTLFKLGFSDED